MYAQCAGHSLGAAVASLCALQVLKQLPPEQHHTVSSIGFASPAFGNAALAAYVEEQGWEQRFTNYLLPGELQISTALPDRTVACDWEIVACHPAGFRQKASQDCI